MKSVSDGHKLRYNRLARNRKLLSMFKGFTIIELMMVVALIGILFGITAVVYSGVQRQAATTALQSELATAADEFELHRIKYNAYPTSVDCGQSESTTNHCIRFNSNNHISFTVDNSASPKQFRITMSSSDMTSNYSTNQNDVDCPKNFIVVPGSATYGTADFCVMKYEAKADDNGDGIGDINQTTGSNTWPANTHPISNSRKLVSTAAGYPVANISQTDSITAASSYTNGCSTGCHLITEAEWMTIAQNVLSVASNWTDAGGTTHVVGTGYIYSGHSDNSPANAIEADANDVNGYTGTGNSSPSNQRRTLTLTNGEVVWDMAGNLYEWTQGTIAGGQQPGLSGESTYAWKQWNNGSLLMNGLPSLSQPSSTGISGISGWSSTRGIGQLYSNYGETGVRAFRRSGAWTSTEAAGILMLHLNYLSSASYNGLGFRVAR
jgi:prepilin-type N-terminal cleavage/methylation domain-containing protein